MNLGTLGPGMMIKPDGFWIRSFLTARVTLMINWATRGSMGGVRIVIDEIDEIDQNNQMN
ncbi:MAG: hypothetical protein FJ117_19380 [Deltaproteobacteria bacterium]|nr:hypothetical protein [Deltaproteobacteria bacterium]